MESVEELYLTGLHLEQYRHATRMPETYWAEGLRRDPKESASATQWDCGIFVAASSSRRTHFQAAIARLTSLNPNPRDGEVYYNRARIALPGQQGSLRRLLQGHLERRLACSCTLCSRGV